MRNTLESKVMCQCGLTFHEAQQLAITARDNLSLQRDSAWSKELEEECRRILEEGLSFTPELSSGRRRLHEQGISFIPAQSNGPNQVQTKDRNCQRNLDGHRARRKRRPSTQPLASQPQLAGALTILTSFLYLYLLWATESFLDGLQNRNSESSRSVTTTTTTTSSEGILHFRNETAPVSLTQPLSPDRSQVDAEHTTTTIHSRYIIYQDYGKTTQGQGNIMAGLLAAHLLGREFHRTVCVDPKWMTFNEAFQVTDKSVAAACHEVLASQNASQEKPPVIRLVNYGTPPNECYLQKLLSQDIPIVILYGNTYPRWPKSIPQGLWENSYRPTAALEALLPPLPTTVVHLRQGDHAADARPGLEPETLQALHELLEDKRKNASSSQEHNVFLVTNQVEEYYPIADTFGWKHPTWNKVVHSAAAGRRAGGSSNENNSLQLWADWYVMTQAIEIYHTPSDFSASAVHWNTQVGVVSKRIMGMMNATTSGRERLILRDETWLEEDETLPLVERKEKDLLHCDIHSKKAHAIHEKRAAA